MTLFQGNVGFCCHFFSSPFSSILYCHVVINISESSQFDSSVCIPVVDDSLRTFTSIFIFVFILLFQRSFPFLGLVIARFLMSTCTSKRISLFQLLFAELDVVVIVVVVVGLLSVVVISNLLSLSLHNRLLFFSPAITQLFNSTNIRYYGRHTTTTTTTRTSS